MSFASDMRPLQRSISLPEVISRHDSGVGYSASSGSCSDLNQIGYQPLNYHNHHHHNNNHERRMPYEARLVSELRQLMTLRQHYYP